jgi:pyridoxine kinase
VTTPIPKTLVISSTVASSRVGASAASFCLQRLGVETVVLPTTLMGRHPGWGAPGGGAVDAARLRDVWEGVKAQNLHFDAVLTGYMGDTEHVALCEEIIGHVLANNPDALIAVDPVMGDHGRLYIPEVRAAAIIERLVPLANFITPNLWERDYIQNYRDALPARLITSYPNGEDIGARWEEPVGDRVTAFQVSHPKFTSVPHGGGDSLAALFLGRRLLGQSPRQALAASVSSVYEIMRAADALDAGELPLIRMQAFITDALPLHVTS